VGDVAADRDREAVEAALAAADGERVEESWVGCSWRPSPALRTAQLTFWARRFTAPECGWRTTRRSGCMALSVIAVSISVSPFFSEEACGLPMVITSAPSRLPASSKEAWVRVEASKNMLTWVRPASASVLGGGAVEIDVAVGEVEDGPISSGARGSIPRRWRARKLMRVS
jgi:hypothetical protein